MPSTHRIMSPNVRHTHVAIRLPITLAACARRSQEITPYLENRSPTCLRIASAPVRQRITEAGPLQDGWIRSGAAVTEERYLRDSGCITNRSLWARIGNLISVCVVLAGRSCKSQKLSVRTARAATSVTSVVGRFVWVSGLSTRTNSLSAEFLRLATSHP